MMPPTTKALERAARNALKAKMKRANLGKHLVHFAQRRMDNGGDSTHRYPELWDHPRSIRAGKTPLVDKGRLKRSLRAKTTFRAKQVWYKLSSRRPLIAAAHQKGFTTRGPNFIPLMRKAYAHETGVDPLDEGLIRGRHYVIAQNGVTVPQRKIFNWPPEDERDFLRALSKALR